MCSILPILTRSLGDPQNCKVGLCRSLVMPLALPRVAQSLNIKASPGAQLFLRTWVCRWMKPHFHIKERAPRPALRKRLEVHVIQKYFKWGSERNIKGISWYAVCIMRTSICNLSIVCLFIVIESEVCICLRLLCLGFYSTFISYWLIQS